MRGGAAVRLGGAALACSHTACLDGHQCNRVVEAPLNGGLDRRHGAHVELCRCNFHRSFPAREQQQAHAEAFLGKLPRALLGSVQCAGKLEALLPAHSAMLGHLGVGGDHSLTTRDLQDKCGVLGQDGSRRRKAVDAVHENGERKFVLGAAAVLSRLPKARNGAQGSHSWREGWAGARKRACGRGGACRSYLRGQLL
jgi:hypothetical protein